MEKFLKVRLFVPLSIMLKLYRISKFRNMARTETLFMLIENEYEHLQLADTESCVEDKKVA